MGVLPPPPQGDGGQEQQGYVELDTIFVNKSNLKQVMVLKEYIPSKRFDIDKNNNMVKLSTQYLSHHQD